MATSEKSYSSDGNQRSCPHGSSVGFPVGTVMHVKIGDMNCIKCPCFGGADESKPSNQKEMAIICHYPNFSSDNENNNRPPSTHL